MQFFDEKEICVVFDEEFNNTNLKSESFLALTNNFHAKLKRDQNICFLMLMFQWMASNEAFVLIELPLTLSNTNNDI